MQNISQAVELGSRFTVNFEKRTLRLNRELVSLDDVNVLPLNGSRSSCLTKICSTAYLVK